jgi:hypothetical protein
MKRLRALDFGKRHKIPLPLREGAGGGVGAAGENSPMTFIAIIAIRLSH